MKKFPINKHYKILKQFLKHSYVPEKGGCDPRKPPPFGSATELHFNTSYTYQIAIKMVKYVARSKVFFF